MDKLFCPSLASDRPAASRLRLLSAGHAKLGFRRGHHAVSVSHSVPHHAQTQKAQILSMGENQAGRRLRVSSQAATNNKARHVKIPSAESTYAMVRLFVSLSCGV